MVSLGVMGRDEVQSGRVPVIILAFGDWPSIPVGTSAGTFKITIICSRGGGFRG
jgi:hypothetical protein